MSAALPLRRRLAGGLLAAALTVPVAGLAQDEGLARLEPAQTVQCDRDPCEDLDAIVFVHGIYGGDDTFRSQQFDWPREFPRQIDGRRLDVYRLNYRSAMLSWAQRDNPSFKEIAAAISRAMTPLRKRRYRSIGFIAHSLGGNVVSTYLHSVKTRLGHPQRSQHAFVITLATPVLGAQIADLGSRLKQLLGINDELLSSLKSGNLYLEMLNEFREEEVDKERRYVCRPVNLHAAYEQEHLGPLLIVEPGSAAAAVSNLVDSPIVGFRLDHSKIAKPDGPEHVVYRWVLDRVRDELRRIATWEATHQGFEERFRLCELTPFVPEP